MPSFGLWMHFQERRGKPALIPNSIWKRWVFTTICLMVFASWAALQSMEWFFSLLYFNPYSTYCGTYTEGNAVSSRCRNCQHWRLPSASFPT